MYALVLVLAAPSNDAAFTVVGAADEPVVGKLLRFSPEFTATLASRTGETAIKDVVSLRRLGRAIPAFPTGRQLITANGDRIAGTLAGVEKDSLRFTPSALLPESDDTWLVPLSSTAALWFVDTPADTPLEPARYSWTEGNKNRDVIRLQNGDTARGVLGFAIEGRKPTFRFRPDAGEAREVTPTELAAIAFNPLLTKPRKPKGPFARVVLSDGSRVALVNLAIAANTVKGETLFGQKVEFPLEVLVALDVLQGKAAYLSDLKPAKVEQTGFLGTAWPWAADRTVRGVPLRLTTDDGGSTFDKGLGTHPRTVLTYDLGGKYRRFEALVGLDPESGDRGRAVVRIRIDGKAQTVPGLAELSSGKSIAVRLDVSKAKELTLEVDYGPAGGVRSDVNWGDARLVE